jgi:hypothetical protein
MNQPPSANETVNYFDDILTKTGIGVVDDDYISILDEFDVEKNSITVTRSLLTYFLNTN